MPLVSSCGEEHHGGDGGREASELHTHVVLVAEDEDEDPGAIYSWQRRARLPGEVVPEWKMVSSLPYCCSF
jgi:hypothetical protein